MPDHYLFLFRSASHSIFHLFAFTKKPSPTDILVLSATDSLVTYSSSVVIREPEGCISRTSHRISTPRANRREQHHLGPRIFAILQLFLPPAVLLQTLNYLSLLHTVTANKKRRQRLIDSRADLLPAFPTCARHRARPLRTLRLPFGLSFQVRTQDLSPENQDDCKPSVPFLNTHELAPQRTGKEKTIVEILS
ncbi:hypothetical protein LZ32DRAFT_162588 [Colletotrichum eremochloae]|nr:hypothetical protein LZ32DRAFT_162588 [Colletotrichum eremochloae]